MKTNRRSGTEGKIPKWGSGHLFIGEKGMLLSDYGKYMLLPEKEFEGYKGPEPTLPRVASHYADWLDACKNGTQASAEFRVFRLAHRSESPG